VPGDIESGNNSERDLEEAGDEDAGEEGNNSVEGSVEL